MQDQFDYYIDTERKVIIERFIGAFGKTEANEYTNRVIQDSNYNSSYNLLMDFRLTQVSFSTEEIRKLIQFLKSKKIYKSARKIAILTKTPNQVANLLRYVMNIKSPNQQYRIFSTEYASCLWICIDADLIYYYNIFDKAE